MKYTKPKMLILTAMKTEMEKIASSLPTLLKMDMKFLFGLQESAR